MTFQETLSQNTEILLVIDRFRATIKSASAAELVAIADQLAAAPNLRKEILALAAIRSHKARRASGSR